MRFALSHHFQKGIQHVETWVLHSFFWKFCQDFLTWIYIIYRITESYSFRCTVPTLQIWTCRPTHWWPTHKCCRSMIDFNFSLRRTHQKRLFMALYRWQSAYAHIYQQGGHSPIWYLYNIHRLETSMNLHTINGSEILRASVELRLIFFLSWFASSFYASQFSFSRFLKQLSTSTEVGDKWIAVTHDTAGELNHGWIHWSTVSGGYWKPLESEIKLYSGRLTWDLQITHLERNMIFQTAWLCSMLIFRGVATSKGICGFKKEKHVK